MTSLARSARGLLEQAAAEGARLAVLPENFAAMGHADLAALGRLEAQGDGPVLPWLRRTARELGLWIVAGTLPLPPDDRPTAKPRACSLLIDAHGERVARYDKLHLFDVDKVECGRCRTCIINAVHVETDTRVDAIVRQAKRGPEAADIQCGIAWVGRVELHGRHQLFYAVHIERAGVFHQIAADHGYGNRYFLHSF